MRLDETWPPPCLQVVCEMARDNKSCRVGPSHKTHALPLLWLAFLVVLIVETLRTDLRAMVTTRKPPGKAAFNAFYRSQVDSIERLEGETLLTAAARVWRNLKPEERFIYEQGVAKEMHKKGESILETWRDRQPKRQPPRLKEVKIGKRASKMPKRTQASIRSRKPGSGLPKWERLKEASKSAEVWQRREAARCELEILMDEMKAGKVDARVCTDILIRQLVLHDVEALSAFRAERNLSLSLDQYDQLIMVAYNQGFPEVALEFYSDQQQLGNSSMQAYLAILKVYKDNRKWEMVEQILSKMTRTFTTKGVHATLEDHASLAEGCLIVSELERAAQILEMAKKRGFKLTGEIMQSASSAFARADLAKLALPLLKEMRLQAVQADEVSYYVAVLQLLQANELAQADSMLIAGFEPLVQDSRFAPKLTPWEVSDREIDLEDLDSETALVVLRVWMEILVRSPRPKSELNIRTGSDNETVAGSDFDSLLKERVVKFLQDEYRLTTVRFYPHKVVIPYDQILRLWEAFTGVRRKRKATIAERQAALRFQNVYEDDDD